MLDIKWIREAPEDLDQGLRRRGLEPLSARIVALDAERREAVTALQEMQTRRNEASKAIGEAKRKGGDAADLIAEVASLKDRLTAGEERERTLGLELEDLLSGLPNTPAPGYDAPGRPLCPSLFATRPIL